LFCGGAFGLAGDLRRKGIEFHLNTMQNVDFWLLFGLFWPFLHSKTSSFCALEKLKPFVFNTFLGSPVLF
jgi:hypothetical protein